MSRVSEAAPIMRPPRRKASGPSVPCSSCWPNTDTVIVPVGTPNAGVVELSPTLPGEILTGHTSGARRDPHESRRFCTLDCQCRRALARVEAGRAEVARTDGMTAHGERCGCEPGGAGRGERDGCAGRGAPSMVNCTVPVGTFAGVVVLATVAVSVAISPCTGCVAGPLTTVLVTSAAAAAGSASVPSASRSKAARRQSDDRFRGRSMVTSIRWGGRSLRTSILFHATTATQVTRNDA